MPAELLLDNIFTEEQKQAAVVSPVSFRIQGPPAKGKAGLSPAEFAPVSSPYDLTLTSLFDEGRGL
jgi:hypothetical protein